MNTTWEAWGLILAAGRGTRMRTAANGMPKQFLLWKERPLFWHSAINMARAGLKGIIFALPEEYFQETSRQIEKFAHLDAINIPWRCVIGGSTRPESVRNGLNALPSKTQTILIHDAARPFASPTLIRKIAETVSPDFPAVIPAVQVADTIKIAQDNLVINTLERNRLRASQTPQGFLLEAIKNLYNDENIKNPAFTDDATMYEMIGGKVKIVEGEAANRKITTGEDLKMLNNAPPLICCGFGYDAHKYGTGRPLRLGGILIPGKWEVIAHSDGDVLLHSLMDALLGMACLGDLGAHFPDSDEKYAGISSAILLDKVMTLLIAQHIAITHIDMTIVAQKPKLSPYMNNIRENVANLLSISASMVNCKATTEEGMGFTGALEGIKAYALISGYKNA